MSTRGTEIIQTPSIENSKSGTEISRFGFKESRPGRSFSRLGTKEFKPASVTFTFTVSSFLPYFTVIIVLPAFLALTKPLVTETTALSPGVYFAAAVTSLSVVVPSGVVVTSFTAMRTSFPASKSICVLSATNVTTGAATFTFTVRFFSP